MHTLLRPQVHKSEREDISVSCPNKCGVSIPRYGKRYVHACEKPLINDHIIMVPKHAYPLDYYSFHTQDDLCDSRSAETNCPMTEDPPPVDSANVTSETMMLSSSTEPQLVHTASPLAWSYSISVPPHTWHIVDMVAGYIAWKSYS